MLSSVLNWLGLAPISARDDPSPSTSASTTPVSSSRSSSRDRLNAPLRDHDDLKTALDYPDPALVRESVAYRHTLVVAARDARPGQAYNFDLTAYLGGRRAIVEAWLEQLEEAERAEAERVAGLRAMAERSRTVSASQRRR